MIIDSPLSTLARDYPSRAFIIADKWCYSTAEIASRVATASVQLSEAGVGTGDRVAILSPNSVDYIVALLSLWKLGVSAVTLNTRAHPSEWWSLLKSADCKYLLVGESQELDETIEYQLISLEGLSEVKTGSASSDQAKWEAWDLEREALVVMTSGSTGKPRGARLSLGNLYYNAIGSNEVIGLTGADCWLLSLPLFHVGGIGILIRTLLAGTSIALPSGKDAGEMIHSISKTGSTHISVVPTLLRELIRHDDSGVLRRLKCIVLGGAAPDSTLIENCLKLDLAVFPTFGLTEAASQVTLGKPESFVAKTTSSGKVLPYRELRITSLGEIELRGKTLFSGYIGEAERYRANDWFPTGDLGMVDPDGELFVLGRKDDMFISGGENIYLSEIEIALSKVTENREAKVIVVADEKWGERPVAFILASEREKIDCDALKAKLATKLAGYKVPDRIILLSEWPLTTTGKIDSGKLRQNYLALEQSRKSSGSKPQP